LGLLRGLLEDSVAQIFRFLMLIYRSEDIHLVYDQMRQPDGYLRADAIEFLSNLVDSPMRAAIFPILDEDRFLSALEGPFEHAPDPAEAYRLIQDAIWDHNWWLSATTLCAVGRLRLRVMRPELEQASAHPGPIVGAAAKVALHLAQFS